MAWIGILKVIGIQKDIVLTLYMWVVHEIMNIHADAKAIALLVLFFTVLTLQHQNLNKFINF